MGDCECGQCMWPAKAGLGTGVLWPKNYLNMGEEGGLWGLRAPFLEISPLCHYAAPWGQALFSTSLHVP